MPMVFASYATVAFVNLSIRRSVTCSWKYRASMLWCSWSVGSINFFSISWCICPFTPEKLTLYGCCGSLATWMLSCKNVRNVSASGCLSLQRSGWPCSAICPIHAPPGYGPPSILATLSKHSPAASSRVCPSLVTVYGQTKSDCPIPRWLCLDGVICPLSLVHCPLSIITCPLSIVPCPFVTRYKSLCPPLTVKHTYGYCRSASALSTSTENTCPMIWLTSMTGLSYSAHNVYAVVMPTTSAHGSPGYAVTEIVSMVDRSTASSSKITNIFSACVLAAISGTTPHRCWCSLVWVYARMFSTWKKSSR